jgi:DNA replication and repair protein RecF
MQVLLPDVTVSIEYLQGWDSSCSLDACLSKNVSRETMVGHSLYGPQRADLSLTVDGFPAQDGLSQGQQKLVSYGLRLAQGLHLQTAMAKTPIYLIDDLPSELDPHKRTLVTEILAGLRAQVFITGIEACDLQEILDLHKDNRMFHVKHGTITKQFQKRQLFHVKQFW